MVDGRRSQGGAGRAEAGVDGVGLLSFNEESFDSFSTPLVGRVGSKGRGGDQGVDAELFDLAVDTPLVDRVGVKRRGNQGRGAESGAQVGSRVGIGRPGAQGERKEKENREVGMEREGEDDDDLSSDPEVDLGHEDARSEEVDMFGGVVSDSSGALRIESGMADLDSVRL